MKKFSLNMDVLLQETLDEAVLLNTTSGNYYEINATAAVMLKRLCTSDTPAEVIDKLVDEYGIDKAIVEKDLRDLIDHLKSLGLIHENHNA